MVANTVANQLPTFAKANTKLYIPVVTLSTQDNAKLFQQLKSWSKATIRWNRYESKTTIQRWNPNLDYLIEPTIKGVNTLFIIWK